MKTTVVIPTHNRRGLLRENLQALARQTISVRAIVMDDASVDGTAEMMAADFPRVEYHRSEVSQGGSWQRNQGLLKAETETVFFLDDDTILQSEETLAEALRDFNRPEVAVVAMPFQNVLREKHVRTQAPDKERDYVTHAFIAAAVGVRRERFLEVGGFREFFGYMGEEGDLCIRLLRKGGWTKLGTSTPAHHMQSPKRVSQNADVFGRRNDIMFVWLNCPAALVLPTLLLTVVKGVGYGIRTGRAANMLRGCLAGFGALGKYFRQRDPVDMKTYRLFRLLKKKQCVPLEEIEGRLPGIAGLTSPPTEKAKH